MGVSPQTGWAVKSTHLLLTLLEAGSLSVGCQPGWVLVSAVFWVADLAWCPHMVGAWIPHEDLSGSRRRHRLQHYVGCQDWDTGTQTIARGVTKGELSALSRRQSAGSLPGGL